MPINDIEKFISANGIKKKWLANEMGMSAELLHHHFKKNKCLPPDLERKAVKALKKLSLKVVGFTQKKEADT